jgi:hypothetical protein
MEKSAKVLHYFGLDSGLLEFFKYSTYSFLGVRLKGKIAVCAHTTRLPKK